MVVDAEQSALFCVTTETYQHLIGCAAGRIIRLPISKHTELSGRLLWAIPAGKKDHESTIPSKIIQTLEVQ